MKRSRRKKIAFTLIELMFVCAIISIIALILLPIFLKSVEKNKKAEETPHPVLSQIKETERLPYRTNPQGNPPVFNSEDIKITLSVEEHRIGMDVYNRFNAVYNGQFLFTGVGPTRLDFKFPVGTVEARDVSLKFITQEGSLEPSDVIYDREGIFWVGTINGSEPVRAEVSFISSGRDRFEYSLPPAGRTKFIKADLNLEGANNYFIPDWALQPTSSEPGHIRWEFSNLVTDRSIVLDSLQVWSPVGRVILMCKLVGIGVLFFGIGFWYLAALYKPEGLYRFRWGHFLLLALNYSLFFVLFGVLGFRGELSTETAIVISAALSLPLLTIHVSRIIDMTFALSRNLPFSIFTLALVINGVYGGRVRDYIFIGSAFLAVAFVTVTFRKWALNREKWMNILEDELAKKVEDLGNIITEVKELEKKAVNVLLETDAPECSVMRESLERFRKNMTEKFQEYETIREDLARLKSLINFSERWESLYYSLRDKIYLKESWFPSEKKAFEASLNKLVMAREEKREKRKVKIEDTGQKIHCFSCGYGGESTPHCPNCGTARPEIISCGKCGNSIKIPAHLLNTEPVITYCITCGEKY